MTADHTDIGVRLQAARRAMGLTQTEVGDRMRMVTSTVSAIEAGKRSITGTELYEFARIYHRPLEFFLGPGPAVEAPGFQYLFRQADQRVLDRGSIAELEQLAADYQLIEELVDTSSLPMPPDYSSFGFHTAEHAESLAEMERSRLGLGDGPLKDLLNLLDELAGVRTFMLPVANQSWSGLLAMDSTGRPCVAVNSKEEPYRRNFDLAHEYAHVLVHLGEGRPEGRVDVKQDDGRMPPEERFAEAFAAAFLMPKRTVLQRLDQAMRASGGLFTDHDLVHLAMYFGVSGQALSLRLVWLRKLSRTAHEKLWKQTASFKALAEILGYNVEDDEWQLPVVLPRRFRYLAFKAYEREIISVSKLAELLREDQHELRRKLEAAQLPPESAANL